VEQHPLPVDPERLARITEIVQNCEKALNAALEMAAVVGIPCVVVGRQVFERGRLTYQQIDIVIGEAPVVVAQEEVR